MFRSIAAGCLLGWVCCSYSVALGDEPKKAETRNPFGVADIADPFPEETLKWGKEVRFPVEDDKKDANAEDWVPAAAEKGMRDALTGEWHGRWTGLNREAFTDPRPAKIVEKMDRIFILFEDFSASYLIEAKRVDRNRYVGSWVLAGPEAAFGGGRCVLLQVDGQRIDGDWESGRWDFRRRLPAP